MSATASTHHIDVAAPAPPRAAFWALALAVLSLPGSLFPWDWFSGGGLVIGVPLAVAAIVVAVRVRRDAASPARARGIALAAIVLAVLVLLIPVAFLAAG